MTSRSVIIGSALVASAGTLGYGIYMKARDLRYEDGWSSVSDEFVGLVCIAFGALGLLVTVAAMLSRK